MYKKFLLILVTFALFIGCGKDLSMYSTDIDESAEIEYYDDFSYQYLSDIGKNSFEFASGVGAWATEITINADGSFVGEYHDSDMGVTGEDYPNGTYFYCKFTGQFGSLEKIDDLTYKTTLESLSWQNEAGTEEIINDTLWVYTTPYGIGEGGDIYFCLPGTKVDTLSEEVLSWLNNRLVLGGYDEEHLTELPCCIMFEDGTEYTWNN